MTTDPDPLAVENLAVEAWHAFAEPFRAAFVRPLVMTTAGEPGDEHYYMPETGEKLPHVLGRVEPRGHTRIVVVAALGGTKYDDTLGFATTTLWKIAAASDRSGHNALISASDGVGAPWVGHLSGELLADMVAALHDDSDIDAELASMLGEPGVGTDQEA